MHYISRLSLLIALALMLPATVRAGTCETTSNAEFGGNWSDVSMWSCTGDSDGIPDEDDDVTIRANHEIFIDSAIPVTGTRARVLTLTIEGGATLRPDGGGTRILELYGAGASALVVDGALGNGASETDLILLVFDAPTISGGGTIDLQRLLKDGASNTTLTIDTDVQLHRSSGAAIYSLGDAGTSFDVTINSGATVEIGSGDASLDGSAGNGLESPAAWTVDGTLTMGGKLHAKSDNTTEAVSLTIGSGGVVEAASIDAASSTAQFSLTVNSGATLRLTDGTFTLTSSSAVFSFDANGTTEFSKSGAQTVVHPDASALGSILRLSGSGTKTLSGAFAVGAAGTVTLSGTATVSGTLTYASGSTLRYEGSAAHTVGDEWPADPDPDDATLVSPWNVVIDRAGGVSLPSDRIVEGTLTFAEGNLSTGGSTVDLRTTGALAGETDTARLIGNVQSGPFAGTGTVTFGNLGFTLTDAAVGNDDPDGQMTTLRTNGTTGVSAFGANQSISCKWRVTYDDVDTFNKNLTLRWMQADDNGKQVNAMQMWRFDDTDARWYPVHEDPQDASGTPRTLSSDITSFSTYSASDSVNPLPVELVAFDAVADGGDVLLQWETASETNNAGFEVQRLNAGDWQVESFVEGHGTTIEAQRYDYRLAALGAGRHIFRLRQIDFDGAFEYSPEVEIVVELPDVYALSAAYPNPFNPETQFTLSVARAQHVRVEVYDVAGRRVALLHDGPLPAHEAHAFTFDAGRLPSGLYLYRAVGETFTASRPAVLQK